MPTNPITAAIIEWIAQGRRDEGQDPLELFPDSPLLEEGVLDSLKLMQFVAWLEGRYGITIGVESLTPKAFATPAAIAGLVQRLAAPPPGQ